MSAPLLTNPWAIVVLAIAILFLAYAALVVELAAELSEEEEANENGRWP